VPSRDISQAIPPCSAPRPCRWNGARFYYRRGDAGRAFAGLPYFHLIFWAPLSKSSAKNRAATYGIVGRLRGGAVACGQALAQASGRGTRGVSAESSG
jgi:hypothetical protein